MKRKLENEATSQRIARPNLIGIARMMWSLLLPRDRAWLVTLFCLMLGAAAFEMFTLFAIQSFMLLVVSGEISTGLAVDQWIASYSNSARLAILSGVLVVIFLGKLVLFLGVFRLLAWVVARQRIVLANRLYEAYQYAPVLWHLRRNTADLQRSLREDVDRVTQGVILQMLQLILNFVISVSVLVFVLVVLPAFLLIALTIIIGILMLAANAAHVLLAQAGLVRRIQSRELIFAIQEGFGALTEARLLHRRGWFQNEFRKAVELSARAQQRVLFIMQSFPLVIETVLMVSLMVIIAVVVVLSESLEEALALSTVLAAAMFRLRQAGTKLASASNKISSASPSLGPMMADLAELQQVIRTDEEAVSVKPGKAQFGELEFESVSFTFPDQTKSALRDVTLTIKAGQHLAVMGQTGAGKSTFLSLLLGLIQPNSGRILIDGLHMDGMLQAWHHQIGYVPQSVFLLDGSIAANVAFGLAAEDRDPVRINAALRAAHLADYVETLPEKLNTQVGQGGSRLSGGQRQRIGIARALYHEPTVLILDEATSALDSETQAAVLKSLAELSQKPTIVSVTHHIEIMRFSDQVIFLKDGLVSAIGPFQTLLKTSPAFRDVTQLISEEALQ